MDFHTQSLATNPASAARLPGRILRQARPSDDQRGTYTRSALTAPALPDTWNHRLWYDFRDTELKPS